MLFFFFFFQAEDGIRDGTVTGVQTCALPIFLVTPAGHEQYLEGVAELLSRPGPPDQAAIIELRARYDIEQLTSMRSEEHTSELQSQFHLVCRLLPEKKNDTSRHALPNTSAPR